jgi:hypothetical protein
VRVNVLVDSSLFRPERYTKLHGAEFFVGKRDVRHARIVETRVRFGPSSTSDGATLFGGAGLYPPCSISKPIRGHVGLETSVTQAPDAVTDNVFYQSVTAGVSFGSSEVRQLRTTMPAGVISARKMPYAISRPIDLDAIRCSLTFDRAGLFSNQLNVQRPISIHR